MRQSSSRYSSVRCWIVDAGRQATATPRVACHRCRCSAAASQIRVQLQRVHEPLPSLLCHSAQGLDDDLHAAEACEADLLAVDSFVCGDKLRDEKVEE